MVRIYLKHIYEVVHDHSQCRAYLNYLKIRSAKSQNCGGFKESDVADILNVSKVSAKKAIDRLMDYDYIEFTGKSYKIKSHKTLDGKFNHQRYITITEDQLESYSWRNFSSFRAYLTELRIGLNRRNRKRLRRGYYHTDRHGVRTIIKSQSEKEFDTLMAGAYVSKMIGISENTAFKYRKINGVSKYSGKVYYGNQEFLPKKIMGKCFSDEILGVFTFSCISTRSSILRFKGY